MRRWIGDFPEPAPPAVLRGDPAAIPVLVELVCGTSYNAVRRRTASALGALSPDHAKASHALQGCLHHEDPAVRLEAALALWKNGQHREEAAEVICKAIREHLHTYASTAIAYLARETPDAGVPIFAELLKDRADHVRWQAASWVCNLARERPGPGVHALLRIAAQHEDEVVRNLASEALRD